MTYTIRITEVVEGALDPGQLKGLVVVECQMNANSDEVAAEVMSDLFLSVSKHNNISTNRLNANLYKTQWINGI